MCPDAWADAQKLGQHAVHDLMLRVHRGARFPSASGRPPGLVQQDAGGLAASTPNEKPWPGAARADPLEAPL